MQMSLSHPVQARPINQTAAHRQVTAKDIFGYGQMLKGAEFLVNHTNAPALGVGWRSKTHHLAIQLHLTTIVAINAGEQLHHGAFARTILTNEAMDFSRAEIKVNVFQGDHAAITLGNS